MEEAIRRETQTVGSKDSAHGARKLRKLEVRMRKLEVRMRKLEVRMRKLEVCMRKLEVRMRKLEVRTELRSAHGAPKPGQTTGERVIHSIRGPPQHSPARARSFLAVGTRQPKVNLPTIMQIFFENVLSHNQLTQ